MLLTDFSPDSPYWVTWVESGLFQNTKGTWGKKTMKQSCLKLSYYSTVCFTNQGNLNLLMVMRF